MKGLLARIHTLWLQFVLLIVFLLHLPFFWLFSRRTRDFGKLNKARKSCSATFMFLAGILVDIQYEVPLDPEATYVFCPNHTSYLDIPLMCLVGRGAFRFMGKEELLSNPLFRVFFKTIDIPVNRDNKRSGYRAFRRSAEGLDKGMSLILFPEGTISPHPPEMLPFKSGAFRLAIEKGVPVVPVSMLNTWDILYDKGKEHGSRPGIIHIFVHQALPTAGLRPGDEDLLRDRVAGQMQAKLLAYARK